ncbi:MAG: SocA family protein [Tannerellaceae bacterium]|jgi:uncharacterized phage-associated protein|nr:SocA family protein [Tannerellaceae bacterium]
MKTMNNNKIKATILYVLNSIHEGVDFLKLFKIIYFANQRHLSQYGRSIVDDKFVAMQNGPVLTNTYSKLRTDKFDFVERNPEEGYMLFAKELPDMDELSISDIECLDCSIKENKNLTFKALSDKSHDSAWQIAWDSRNGKNSVYMDLIEIARAGGASDEMIDYIKEDLFIDSCL